MPGIMTIAGPDLGKSEKKPKKPRKPRRKRDASEYFSYAGHDRCVRAKNPRNGCELISCDVGKRAGKKDSGWRIVEQKCPRK